LKFQATAEKTAKNLKGLLFFAAPCTFKLTILVFKALHGLAPRYLADDCQLVTDAGRRHLYLSESATCVLQRTNTRFGDRAF